LVSLDGAWSVMLAFLFGIFECDVLGIQPVDVVFQSLRLVINKIDMLLLTFFPIVLQGRLQVL
jgi:hypothetical protein